MTTRYPQTPSSDGKDEETAQIFTFSWDTTTMALSRYRSRFFLIYIDGQNHLEPGKRIHSSLNAVSWYSNHHSKKGPKVASFWLNCSRGNGDEDSSGALYQLVHADPPLVRSTGRKRKEVSADGGVATVDCEEFEVLLPEEGLIRQCYYCLSWEDDGRRYSQIKHDKYWCSKVRVFSTRAQFSLWLTECHVYSVRRKGVCYPRSLQRRNLEQTFFTPSKGKASIRDILDGYRCKVPVCNLHRTL